MQVVLLAAGMGVRLGDLTRALPKAMIPVNGRPLIDYALSRLLGNQRVEEVMVVGGFEYSLLKRHLEDRYGEEGDRLRVFENKQYRLGNLYTLQTALPSLRGPVLICNVDHLYPAGAWATILQDRDEISIFCDFKRVLASDEMKVKVDGKRQLVAMSKTLEDFEGGYVGLTFVPAHRLDVYKNGVRKAFDQFGEKALVENILPILAAEGFAVQALPFDEYPWHEVDTPEDLKKAEAALRPGSGQALYTHSEE